METAEKLDATSSWKNDEGSRQETVEAVVSRDHAAVLAHGRWLRWLAAIQVIVLAAVAAGAVVTRDLIVEVRRSQLAQADVVNTQLAALASQTKTIDSEVNAVRQVIASRQGEDVIFLKVMVLRPSIDPDLARRIAKSVNHYSELYRRDPDLTLAIMEVESNFDPNAISNVGATGLMQVMPHWKKVLGIQGDLRDVDVSVQYGMQVLGFYQEMYRDLELALTAYNRGPGPVDWALVKGKDPQNGYAPKVLQVYEKLKKMSASPEVAKRR